VGAAFGLGAVLIFCASLLPSGKKTAAELWRLYRSEFAIVGCLLLPAAGGRWTFGLLLLAMAWRGQFEMFELFGQPRMTGARIIGLIAALILVAAGIIAPVTLPLAVPVCLVAVLIAGAIAERSFTAMPVWLALLCLLFPALLLALTGFLRGGANGFGWIFLAYATVEMNDAFALLAGKLFGRHRLLPRLSPGKTAIGLFAGVVAGGATGFAIALYLMGMAPAPAVLVTATILAAGLAGDFLTSVLKRWRHRKDFAPVARDHGGVLDIYDSVLFAAPALLLLRLGAGL
jgi:phosphatidate cytidylyltransferase